MGLENWRNKGGVLLSWAFDIKRGWLLVVVVVVVIYYHTILC